MFPGIQGGPLEHVIAAKAVCFKEALDPSFKVYAQSIIDNAKALADGLMKRDVDIVSGGTDNHLMLVDLTRDDLTGKEVEKWLDEAHITANKNTIPNEQRSPFVTSGIRLGTPAVTTRGMNTEDMDRCRSHCSCDQGERRGDRKSEGDCRRAYCEISSGHVTGYFIQNRRQSRRWLCRFFRKYRAYGNVSELHIEKDD